MKEACHFSETEFDKPLFYHIGFYIPLLIYFLSVIW